MELIDLILDHPREFFCGLIAGILIMTALLLLFREDIYL